MTWVGGDKSWKWKQIIISDLIVELKQKVNYLHLLKISKLNIGNRFSKVIKIGLSVLLTTCNSYF